MVDIIVKPENTSISVDESDSLLDSLRKKNIYIKSSCGGNASCGDCVIKVASGEDNLTPPTFEEIKLLGNVFHITRERLSCQSHPRGNVTIDVSNHDLSRDQERLKNKSSSLRPKSKVKSKVRKKKEVEERKLEKTRALQGEQRDQDEDWKRHWEKDSNKDMKNREGRKLGGGKRPRPFKTPDDEE